MIKYGRMWLVWIDGNYELNLSWFMKTPWHQNMGVARSFLWAYDIVQSVLPSTDTTYNAEGVSSNDRTKTKTNPNVTVQNLRLYELFNVCTP